MFDLPLNRLEELLLEFKDMGFMSLDMNTIASSIILIFSLVPEKRKSNVSLAVVVTQKLTFLVHLDVLFDGHHLDPRVHITELQELVVDC